MAILLNLCARHWSRPNLQECSKRSLLVPGAAEVDVNHTYVVVTVHIDCRSFLSRVRISVRPSKFCISEKTQKTNANVEQRLCKLQYHYI